MASYFRGYFSSQASTDRDLKASAKKQASIINASLTGVAAKKSATPKDPHDYVKINKVIIDLQIAALHAQRQLLDDLDHMTDEDKKETLFFLLDKDGCGKLDAMELSDGIRKIHGGVDFEKSMSLAIEHVTQFDKEGNGKLGLDDFKNYADTLSMAGGSSFSDISNMMVMKVLFEEGNDEVEAMAGESIKDKVTASIVEKKVEQKKSLEKSVNDARMRALFQLFDSDGTGEVDFKEAVMGLYRITNDLKGSAKSAFLALLLCDDDCSRGLNYDQFCKFIIEIVAVAQEKFTFNDIADYVTLLSGSQENVQLTAEEVNSLYEMNDSLEQILLEKETDEILKGASDSQIRKANSLFYLWDSNEDGKISLKEMIMGLRKFERTSDMGTTVDKAIALMESYDINGDNHLDEKEFTSFSVQFANMAKADLDETLDFMIVKSSIGNDNEEAEMKFLNAIDDGDITKLSASN